jgi:hypothetical protein
MNEKLTEDNFLLFCAKYYDNSRYTSTEEFIEDLNRIKYIKKLITRYIENDDLRERLILNHIIVLGNLFGVEATTKMLFFKIEKKFWSQIKTFLVFLNYMPMKVIVSPGVEIIDNDIPLDETILETLKII